MRKGKETQWIEPSRKQKAMRMRRAGAEDEGEQMAERSRIRRGKEKNERDGSKNGFKSKKTPKEKEEEESRGECKKARLLLQTK